MPIRYIGEGAELCPTGDVQRVLGELVENVLGRLEEQGIQGTTLADEWHAVVSADDDEMDFAVAAARLGLDPYAMRPDIAGLLETLGSKIEGELLADFLDAVEPTQQGILDGVTWIRDSVRKLRASRSGLSEQLVEIRKALAKRPPRGDRPWLLGWEAGRLVRAVMGLDARAPFEFDGLIPVAVSPSEDPGFVGLGGETPRGGHALIASRKMTVPTERFARARALWHFAKPAQGGRFLVTASHTDRQKVERAFAAELLAPAQGIERFILDEYGVLYVDEVDAVAEHFRVSPRVITHQIENQLELELDGGIAFS